MTQKSIVSLLALLIFFSCSKSKTPANSCNVTPVISYQNTIKPIIDSKCNNCHSYPGVGGIFLDNHQLVHDLAMNGTLFGVIHSLPNYTPMPPQGYPNLDSCETIQIDKWIEQGALNN